jgi:hypothetical protein
MLDWSDTVASVPTSRVLSMTGVSQYTLNNWVERGFVETSSPANVGRGHERLFTYRNVALVTVANAIRFRPRITFAAAIKVVDGFIRRAGAHLYCGPDLWAFVVNAGTAKTYLPEVTFARLVGNSFKLDDGRDVQFESCAVLMCFTAGKVFERLLTEFAANPPSPSPAPLPTVTDVNVVPICGGLGEPKAVKVMGTIS